MYMYMYVYVCVCMCMCMYVYVCVYVHICANICHYSRKIDSSIDVTKNGRK